MLAARAAQAEDLVDLLVRTPRAALTEELITRIRAGMAPDHLLRALCVAACREVSPYPDLGFKYHAVMMLQSTYLSTAAMPPEERWLPLLWTADYFKAAAAQEDRYANWSLPQITVAASDSTPDVLANALRSWDAEAADRATAALVNAGRGRETMQMLTDHAARDFRAIGHKTIAAANALRLCSLFGDTVVLPLARSLALAVQNPEGDDPARHEYPADADWQHVETWSRKLPNDWQSGGGQNADELLEVLRRADSQTAVAAAVSLMQHQVRAAALWDVLLQFAAELILRRNDLIGVHANTTVNAMRYGYLASEADASRRLLILQTVAFMARFRALIEARGGATDRRIDALEPLPVTSVDEIFSTLGQDRFEAVRQAYGWLGAGGDAAALAQRVRRYATLKNSGTHDIKFTEAMLENHTWVAAKQPHALLAASLMYGNASSMPDNELVSRARTMLMH
jgi:hypothetical protein